MSTPQEQRDADRPPTLKDPEISAFLAWLIPGLGHLYQGRRAKAAIYFVCIMGLFCYGVYLGSAREIGWGRVVYFSRSPARLPYICQLGVGIPAMPALVQAYRMNNNKEVLWGGFMAPPWEKDKPFGQAVANMDQPTIHEVHLRLARFFELGTVFTLIAGLLNILAIFDAYAGPVLLVDRRKSETEAEEEAPADAPAASPA